MLLKAWMEKSDLIFQETYYLVKNILEVDDFDIEISEFVEKILNYNLNLRSSNIPLAKIIEKKHFYKELFVTTMNTLDPRPESEFLIEEILKFEQKPRTIMELGVGTGCIILSLLKELPKATGLGIDICDEALKISKLNAILLKINKVKFIKNNFAFNLKGEYDLIISNPPYVDSDIKLTEETLHDPKIALFGDINTYIDLIDSIGGLKFKALVLEAPLYLLDKIIEILKNKFLNSTIIYKEIYNSQIYYIECKLA